MVPYHLLLCYILLLFSTCSLCWFSFQNLPSDWLERLFWGRLLVEIISMKTRLKSTLCLLLCVSPSLHNIFHTPMARYSLYVLKVPQNTNQPYTFSHHLTKLSNLARWAIMKIQTFLRGRSPHCTLNRCIWDWFVIAGDMALLNALPDAMCCWFCCTVHTNKMNGMKQQTSSS